MEQKKSILLNLNEKLKDELEAEAKKKGLNLTSYIRMLLLERKKND